MLFQKITVFELAILGTVGAGFLTTGATTTAADEAERISRKSINNAVVDIAPEDIQMTTSVLDLGKGNLVSAFADTGSVTSGDHKHGVGFAWSSNGGKSWTDAGALPDSAPGDRYPPVLAYGEKAKRVYLATVEHVPASIQVFRSNDKGHSFGPPVTASLGTFVQHYMPHIAVDNVKGAGNGNVYACWTNNSGTAYSVYVTRSTNKGASFLPAGVQPVAMKGFGCQIAIGPKHEVNLFYFAGDSTDGVYGDNKIFTRRSLDQGATFGPEIMVADLKTMEDFGYLALNGSGTSNSFPRVAINHSQTGPGKMSGQIYVAYNDDPTPANQDDDNADIFLTMSNDRGKSWSAPKRVNDDKAGEQYEPSIAFDDNGNLMIGYYSRSHDMAENLFFHRRGRLGALKGKKGKKYALGRSFQMSANTPAIFDKDWNDPDEFEGFFDQIAGRESMFTSTFSMNMEGGPGPRYQPDVYAARIKSMPTPADLQVSIVKAPKKIELGRKGAFKVEVSSSGGTADDAFLAIPRLPGLNFTKVKGRNCALTGDYADCNLGKLKAGKTKTVKLTAYAAYKPSGKLLSLGTTSSKDTRKKNNKEKAKAKVKTGGAVTATVTSGTIAVAIPNTASVDVPLALPPGGPMAYVMPRVRLVHADLEDLTVSLISPSGKEIILARENFNPAPGFGNGANDCSGTPVVFDDRAATAMYDQSGPIVGSYRPEEPLSDVAGLPSTGTWKLRVTNNNTALGTIGCVSMTATRQP